MIILGLTGSIGMGKSTAARQLRRLGYPVHDADAVVHQLLARGGAAVPAIAALFPGVVLEGAVDRKALGAVVFGDPSQLRRLEGILHPLVRQAEQRFLARARRQRRRLVVLDIPLLFETGGQARCDAVAVVSAPPFVQARRVLSRPGMTPDRLAAIRRSQMPDSAKCRRADRIIPTGRGYRPALRALVQMIGILLALPGSSGVPLCGWAAAQTRLERCSRPHFLSSGSRIARGRFDSKCPS